LRVLLPFLEQKLAQQPTAETTGVKNSSLGAARRAKKDALELSDAVQGLQSTQGGRVMVSSSRLTPRMNFGSAALAALRLQKVYEQDPRRSHGIHSLEIRPGSWAFTFFLGEDDPNGSLLACSDFRVSASEEDNWEPRLAELVTPSFPPSPPTWASQVGIEFSRHYLEGPSETASEQVARTVLDMLAEEDLGNKVLVEDWDSEHICLNFLKSCLRLGLSCKPGESLGWWCFFHGNGVTHSSPRSNSQEDVCGALETVLADAKTAYRERGCRWCCVSKKQGGLASRYE
jgi:hypothetical protein